MPTSPHWVPTNSPEISEKNGAFFQVDVGIDPYAIFAALIPSSYGQSFQISFAYCRIVLSDEK